MDTKEQNNDVRPDLETDGRKKGGREADDGTAASAQTTEDTVTGPELEALRSKAAERDEYLDLLQRTRAEFENYQKRASKDRDQERRYIEARIITDLLPVVDNLARALEAARQVGETGPLVQGVTMVQSQFLDLLKRYGITPIDALGKPFDPHLHQAVMQQESRDVPPNTIIQVINPGYMQQERVLRPAHVVVSK
jgi:molecular chaperone GrpE